jgi:hypothetical protein
LATVTGKGIWHSPGANWDHDDGGAVEVFAPLAWLERDYPNSLYIENKREKAAWFASCERAYRKSARWTHPIWRYPLSQFPDYYDQYYGQLHRLQRELGLEWLKWDITATPGWQPLCVFLGVNEPNEPFPNVDRFGRAA